MNSAKSSLYLSPPPRVKRTHAATQMKRVQRVEDSLAQVWGRPQCGFHIQPPTDSPRKARQSQCVHAKTHSAAPPTPFSRSPRPFVSPSGSPPENAQSRNEQTKSDNRTTIRERASSDLDPRRNRNETYRKPSCLALMRQTAGVIKRKTFRENRIAPQNSPRAHNPLCRSYNRRDATPRRPAIHDPMKQNNAASRQRGHTPPLSAARPAPPRVHPTRQYDGPAQKNMKKTASQNIRFERRFLLYICALCRPKGRRRKRPYSASRYGL